MSSICIYPKCRIGQKDGERKVTFEIPKEKDLLAEWLEKIPFVNFGTIDIVSFLIKSKLFQIISYQSRLLLENSSTLH
jgi:hypothetical protein